MGIKDSQIPMGSKDSLDSEIPMEIKDSQIPMGSKDSLESVESKVSEELGSQISTVGVDLAEEFATLEEMVKTAPMWMVRNIMDSQETSELLAKSNALALKLSRVYLWRLGVEKRKSISK